MGRSDDEPPGRRHDADDRVQFLALALEPREHLVRFLEESPFEYPIGIVSGRTGGLCSGGLPQHVIIGPSGNFSYLDHGAGRGRGAKLAEALRGLLDGD